MRIAGFLTVLAFSLTCSSLAQATVLLGFTPDPPPTGVSGMSATTTPTASQMDNEPYTGSFVGNANQVTMAFTYNDMYLGSITDIRFRTATRDTINDGGAKEFAVTVTVTNSSTVALEELTFTLDPLGGLTFDTADAPLPVSPLSGFTSPVATVLTFGMLGGSTLAAGATGMFQFALDVPDGIDGITYTAAAQVTPEPASLGLAMLAVSLGAAGVRRRRRATKSPEDATQA